MTSRYMNRDLNLVVNLSFSLVFLWREKQKSGVKNRFASSKYVA